MSNLRDVLENHQNGFKTETGEKNYITYIEDTTHIFLAKLSQYRNTLFEGHNITNTALTPSVIFDSCEQLLGAIKKSHEFFLQNQPAKAKKILEDQLTLIFDHPILTLKKELSINQGENFYRIRLGENMNYSKQDVFHIPFNSRNKVSEQRFSIVGCPSLYIGNSVYTTWIEMGRPKVNEVNIIRLESTSQIKVLNLQKDFYNRSDLSNSSFDELVYFAIVYPLILATSITVKNPKDPFKEEYVISKMLTEIIFNNDDIQGIAYNSTKVMSDSNNRFFNVVLPGKQTVSTAIHCPHLTNLFKLTESYNWSNLEFINFQNGSSPSSTLNPYINTIQLVSNHPTNYSETKFGNLEKFLLNQSCTPI